VKLIDSSHKEHLPCICISNSVSLPHTSESGRFCKGLSSTNKRADDSSAGKETNYLFLQLRISMFMMLRSVKEYGDKRHRGLVQ